MPGSGIQPLTKSCCLNCVRGLSLPWSYGGWIYNYLYKQCLAPLMWVKISIRARCITLCDKVCQWLATGRWFSPGSPVSSTNKTDRYDITEVLLKVALNTIKQTNKLKLWYIFIWKQFVVHVFRNGHTPTIPLLFDLCQWHFLILLIRR